MATHALNGPGGHPTEMFKGNKNLAVGLFISTALLAIAGFSIWLAGTKGNQPMDHYSILFEIDVGGLSVGGPVFYLGVNVGRVADMRLIPGPHVKVQVDIDVEASTPIDSGSTASLNAQGITGVTVINISGKPGPHAPLTPTEGFKYPLIPVKQTGLSAMLADAPHIIIKMNHLLDQANELLGEDNRKAISQMLHNIESLTAALDGERDEIAALPLELKSLLQEARSTVGEVNQLVQSVQPDASEILANLNAATANMEALSQKVDQLVAENQLELDHFIDNGLGQVPELIFDVRTTLRDMQKLLRQLQEDPSQLILRSPDDALKVKP